MRFTEINAASWYLRALHAHDRIDDRPAPAEIGETDPDYVATRTAQWDCDTSYTWAVCEPTTGELLAEVVLDPRTAALSTRARSGHADAAAVAAETVRRFAVANGIGVSSS
jgi:hypothetical protein